VVLLRGNTMNNQSSPPQNFKINWENTPPDFWKKVTDEDAFPQELLNVNEETLTLYYQAAAQLLEEEKWDEAAEAFVFLTFLNPTYQNFWLGLGIAQQGQSKFQEAIESYLVAYALS
jgi:tetratricopeptide (TPR) repeat protein